MARRVQSEENIWHFRSNNVQCMHNYIYIYIHVQYVNFLLIWYHIHCHADKYHSYIYIYMYIYVYIYIHISPWAQYTKTQLPAGSSAKSCTTLRGLRQGLLDFVAAAWSQPMRTRLFGTCWNGAIWKHSRYWAWHTWVFLGSDMNDVAPKTPSSIFFSCFQVYVAGKIYTYVPFCCRKQRFLHVCVGQIEWETHKHAVLDHGIQ